MTFSHNLPTLPGRVSTFWTARQAARVATALVLALLGASLAGMAYGSEPESSRPGAILAGPFQFSERAAQGLPQDLLGRMEREASRYCATHPSDLMETSSHVDTVAEERRARDAERIVMRAVNRTLESQLDLLSRATPGVRAAVAWLEGFGQSRDREVGREIDHGPSPEIAGGAPDASRFTARFGVRLDAHPRLVLSSRLARFQGRLEVPLLNEPLRLTIERSFGARNRAVLTSALERDGRGWAALGLSLSF